MFGTGLKRLSWGGVFCILLIAGWFIVKIIIPSLAATPPTTPAFRAQVTPWAGNQEIAFTPDGKQILDLYDNYLNQSNGIRRWDVQSGKELSPIKSREHFRLLSKSGLFYVTYDAIKTKSKNVRIYRISDQKQIGILPDGADQGNPVQLLGTKPLIATFDIRESPTRVNRSTERRFSIWDVPAKKFISTTPAATTFYDFDNSTTSNVAFSEDGTKVLSLWPVFTGTFRGKTTQSVENLDPWPNSMNQTPKEAWLLNELNGNITKLPFPQKNHGFQFIWEKPALSKDGKLYASVNSTNFGGFEFNGEDGTIWCYDLPHQSLLWKYYSNNQGPDKLMFSPDGTMLADGGYAYDYRGTAGYLSVIDTHTGKLIHSFTEQTLWGQISDRTRNFITGKIYDIAFFKKRFGASMDKYYATQPPGNSGLPTSLAWSPDSKTLAASYADGSLKLWRVKNESSNS